MQQLRCITGFTPFALMIFLNAFVDLGHKIIIQNTLFKTYDGDPQIVLTAIVNALILLPFVMLFSPSGFIADRYPKNRVMRVSAWLAVVLTLAITVCYYLGWFWPAFAMTFLLAMQSAFYSPAKYGYIKELVGKETLARANGAVQAITTTAILAGIFFFSVLFEKSLAGATYGTAQDIMTLIAPVGWVLVAMSLVELFLAYRLPQQRQPATAMRFNWAEYRRGRYLRANLATAWHNPVIWLSIVGLSVFWAISQVMVATFPAFAKDHLAIVNTVVIQGMLAASGAGIILGSLITAKLSRAHIETGLIPIGALGIAVALFLIPGLNSVPGQVLNFVAIGMFGSFILVPLNALIQFHAGEQGLGRVLAASNFVQNITMLGFLGVTVASALFRLGGVTIITGLGVVAVSGALYTLFKLPQSLIRFVVGRLISTRYHLQVIGLRHLPAQGGVLLLGNHISWLDWAMVQLSSPRPVRFVMARSIYERWYLKWFLDIFGVIPISRGRSKESLETVNVLLNAGEAVCLFPEGAISRTGQLGEFKKGFERAAEGANAVILPFYLRGLWGSRFSRAGGGLKFQRRTQGTRNVVVAFGPALDIAATSETVKQAVFELSASSWREHVDTLPTLPEAWLETACRDGGAIAVIDSTGQSLTRRRLVAATLMFARRLSKRAPEQHVGILMPASSAGAIANMAVLSAGKTVVNLNYTANTQAIQVAIDSAEVKHILTARRVLKKLEDRGVDVATAFGKAQFVYMEDIKEEIGHGEQLMAFALASLLPGSALLTLFGRRAAPEDTAAILFSSGSEGTPKGIELTHRNLMANVEQVADVLNTETEDIVLSNLPLFHAFGLTVTTFMPLLEGMTIVCHPDPTDAVGTAKAIARYKTTLMCSTSTFLRFYIKSRRVHSLMLQSLRLVVAGAERLNPEVREAFSLKFGKTIYEGYGATETTPVASVNVPDQLDTEYWQVQVGNRPGTVGLPLPGSSFRIVDPQTLETLPPGEDGLILIGGVQVMKGYLNAPEKTADAIVELDGLRWYKTGDKGHLDMDGFLTIVDRFSRFAKLGGEMVSLSLVEDQIRAALGETEAEVLAVNLPDDRKGERIVLLFTGDLDPVAMRTRLLDKGYDPLTLPARFQAVEEIPKLGSGKTDFSAAKHLAAT